MGLGAGHVREAVPLQIRDEFQKIDRCVIMMDCPHTTPSCRSASSNFIRTFFAA